MAKAATAAVASGQQQPWGIRSGRAHCWSIGSWGSRDGYSELDRCSTQTTLPDFGIFQRLRSYGLHVCGGRILVLDEILAMRRFLRKVGRVEEQS